MADDAVIVGDMLSTVSTIIVDPPEVEPPEVEPPLVEPFLAR